MAPAKSCQIDYFIEVSTSPAYPSTAHSIIWRSLSTFLTFFSGRSSPVCPELDLKKSRFGEDITSILQQPWLRLPLQVETIKIEFSSSPINHLPPHNPTQTTGNPLINLCMHSHPLISSLNPTRFFSRVCSYIIKHQQNHISISRLHWKEK